MLPKTDASELFTQETEDVLDRGGIPLMSLLVRAFLDLLFPRACVGCGRPPGTEFLHLCWDCVSGLAYIRGCFCRVCGDPAEGLVGDDWVCATCAETPPAFNLARSAARYRGVLREAVMMFKYDRAVWLAQDLALLLAGLARGAWLEGVVLDGVLAVPLHPRKERIRTYNQSGLLAAGLARALGKPLLGGSLVRTRDQGTQTHLTARDRTANVRGAFGVRKPDRVVGRRLLLVDDVMTTGATANACARALKNAGASAVYVATVARG
jgi:ComF family protein